GIFRMKGRRLRFLSIVGVSMALIALAAPSNAATGGDWPAYLSGPSHWSFAPSDVAITPANAANLTQVWSWTPDPPQPGDLPQQLNASPTVSGGAIYIGTNS